MKIMLVIAALALLGLLLSRRGWVSVPGSSIHVIDGDTFSVTMRRQLIGRPPALRIRPVGYDAPEIGQAGGREAAAELRALLKTGLRFKPLGLDPYERELAIVRIGEDGRGGDLATHMVLAGHGWPDRDGGFLLKLSALVARIGGRGLWRGTLLGLRAIHPSAFRLDRAMRGTPPWERRR